MSGEQIKPGYKRTEVGVIPEEWCVDRIANLAAITTGDKNTQDRIDDGEYPFFVRSQTALLHKARPRRHSPDPRRSYAIAIVSGVPSSVKRLSNATRTCSSVTWRSNVRAITRSPSRLKQCILVSTKLRRW